jgi:hypothetical protein
MTDSIDERIELNAHLMRDGETVSVRYACSCGCKPQVKLRADAPAAHEHCCCGIAHAAGPNAREHLESYLADRKTAGEDVDRTYAVTDVVLADPRGGSVSAAYAIPSTKNPH